MTEAVFAADPTRLLVAAAAGIVLLLLLIIKFKFHPVLSLLISALVIGLGAGMPVPTLVNTVEKGAGETLQGIVLLIGLGSLFGGILEVSGGAQCVAQTLVNKCGEKKAGIALGITGLVVGTTVFFEAGVVILIPLAFGLAKKTRKSTLYYVIPLLAGLATGYWKSKDEIKENWQLGRAFESEMDEEKRNQLLKGWKRAVRCAIAWAEDDE